MTKRFRNSDPTANTAIKAADKSKGMPLDVALREAAAAKTRGDLAGYDRFMAAARKAGGGL